MEDEAPQSQPEKFSESLLADAIERLKTRGGRVKQFAIMQLPTPVLNDFCAKLMTQQGNIQAAAEWLAGECAQRGEDAPSRSSCYRFSEILFEEYNLAKLARTQGVSQRYMEALTEGDPNAMAMAINRRFGELLTDTFMRMQNLEEIDDTRLMALTGAAKAVAAITFDKQKMDARIKALEKLNEERDAAIKLKDQQLKAREMQFDAALKELQSKAEKKAGKGGISSADIVQARKMSFGGGA